VVALHELPFFFNLSNSNLMNKFYIFILIFINIINVKAQKYDYNWLMAEGKLSNDNYYGSFLINFQDLTNPKITSISQSEYGQSKLSISDENGNFIFYSTGAKILDSNYKVIEDGDTINAGYIFNTNFTKTGGYPFINGIISIPSFENQCFNVIYCHKGVNKDMTEFIPSLMYSKICFLNNKLKVIEKDLFIINDTINETGMNMCKHANGRDWWLLKTDKSNQSFYKVLINKEGFKIVDIQQVDTTSEFCEGLGQSVFSPDGSVLACLDEVNGLRVFDFDRCSGYLSLRESIPQYKDFQFSGVAISPNNQYLYTSLTHNIIQHDLKSNNLYLSRDTVAKWDSSRFENFWENNFSSMQLAPDGKIYITTSSSSRTFYTLDFPDRKGSECHITKFETPSVHWRGLPQYPNYRLGPLKGSPCDTVSVATKDIKPEDYGIKLFPNPSSTIIKIDITIPQYDPTIKTEVVVVDVSGAIVMRYVMPDFAYLATLDISKLPSGVYGVQLRQPQRSGAKVLATEKLVVISDAER